MATKRLTKADINKLPPGKHSYGDGLLLHVSPNGARAWVLRVTIKGGSTTTGTRKRAEIGLGGISYTSLEDAREKAYHMRKLAKQGLDPRTAEGRDIPSFETFAAAVHRQLEPTFKNPKHAAQWITTLREYAFPYLGGKRLDQIGQPELLRVMNQPSEGRDGQAGDFWLVKNETANRTLQRIGKVLDHAAARGFRSGENPITILRRSNVLPKHGRTVKHHESLPWQDLPAFWQALAQIDATSADALRFTILTAARSSEMRLATWDEIDLDTATWAIPAERMKMNRPHRVPLPAQVIDLLQRRADVLGQEGLLFEGTKRGKPLSDRSVKALLERMGHASLTPHGFRSTFRTWAAEHGVDDKLAELALAHDGVKSKVQAAYDRADLLEQRRPLMQSYADFAASVNDTKNVVALQR